MDARAPLPPHEDRSRTTTTEPAGAEESHPPDRRDRTGLVHVLHWVGDQTAVLHAALLVELGGRPGIGARSRSGFGERAQGTVEYALVLLGAAALALAVVAWVTRSDAVGRLFDSVIGRILDQAN